MLMKYSLILIHAKRMINLAKKALKEEVAVVPPFLNIFLAEALVALVEEDLADLQKEKILRMDSE